MNIAIVVQRYGADISGGAELHARYIAELLSSRVKVRVLTTCARDHLTWKNEFPAGEDQVNGVPVERFRVDRERSIRDFGIRSRRVFTRYHSLQEELDWLDSEGPVSSGLIARLRRAAGEFDLVVLFSVRYHHAYFGARAVPDRAVLVPTAEREPALALAIFQPIFRGVRAIMYNSPEERAAIQGLAHNEDVPGVVVGVGSRIPPVTDAARVRLAFNLSRPFVLYVGRIEENKGCAELFDYFVRYAAAASRPPLLVLIGTPVIEIPTHPRVRHLGAVTDRDKFDAVAGAQALVMPSYFESLSMVMLEAWALGRPVLANGRCDVLAGQCLRSNGGLYYRSEAEFAAMLDTLLQDDALAAALGRNGRAYYERHYAWSVIEQKYLDMFSQLEADGGPVPRMPPLPGWFRRRRRTLPAAAEIVDRLPRGPVVPRRGGAAREDAS
jgi:glycosyltransferase involved in cell wall biosynthesis